MKHIYNGSIPEETLKKMTVIYTHYW